MSRIIRLTENDISRIVRRVIMEEDDDMDELIDVKKNEEEKVQVVLANTKLNQKQVITEIIGIKNKLKIKYYE